MSDLLQRLQDAVGDAYRIERELPGGGMSRLFYAIEASLDREVVIKLLPPEWSSDVSAERFRQEIQLAAHLQHPNVLPVLTAGASGDLVYYVMPYVRGESLRHRLVKDGKLPVPDALRILHEVADALAYAHANGVVHRDIKPENILLQEGHAVLTDFGVARAVAAARSGGRLTGTGVALGTPGYMSPEQVAGEEDIDARADVYALAVVGYEMLSGGPPFTGPTAQAVIAAHLTETPEAVDRLRPEVPRSVATTITQALVKSPQERLQSAAAFRDGVLAAHGAGAGGASRPNRRLVAGAAAVAVVAVAAVGIFWPRGYHVEGDPRHSLIVFPFENRTGDGEYAWLEDAAMNSMGLTMAHWQDLRVYDDERTESLLRRAGITGAGSLDFAAAQRLAREARVGTLVMGDVRRESGQLVFEAKVHDVGSGERLSTEILRMPLTADPRPAFDSLSARILRVSGAEPGERPGVVAQTTRSLDAYRAYLRGSAFLQQLEPDSAERYLNEAIALDSTFALAYLQLRNAEGWREATGGDPAVIRALVAKAELYGADLPPRFRTLIQFYVAYGAGQLRQARAIVQGLIARDSTDVEAWYQLGEATLHDGVTDFPHPDTLGNLGRALAAFQHVLALDSSYTLAYRHTADALESCAGPNMPFLCLADSAVYGMPRDLLRRFGDERVRAARRRARAELATTLRAWTAATPASPGVRERVIEILVGEGMFDEAEVQLDAFRGFPGGLTPVAVAAEAQMLMGQQRYAEAAETFARALADVRDSTELFTPSFYRLGFFPYNGLSPAGRIDEFEKATLRVGNAAPAGTSAGWGLTFGEVRGLQHVLAAGLAAGLRPGTPDSALRAYHQAANDSIRRVTRGDSALTWQLTVNIVLPAYYAPLFAVRLDTTFLMVPGIDLYSRAPSEPLTAVIHAVAALQQGDTATIRRLADEAFPSVRRVARDMGDFYGFYVWGRLFAALGDPQRAVEAYALLDSIPKDMRVADFLVRSWRESAPLYAALGDTARAVELYEKFANAWRNADPELQPLVQQARRAAAALKGEISSPEPSHP